MIECVGIFTRYINTLEYLQGLEHLLGCLSSPVWTRENLDSMKMTINTGLVLARETLCVKANWSLLNPSKDPIAHYRDVREAITRLEQYIRSL